MSASVCVEQIESELAAQLDALRTEIAENVFLQGTTTKSYWYGQTQWGSLQVIEYVR